MCIPTYNGERWIATTLLSVMSQEEDLEIVVSDDASSDATVDIALATGDPRVRVVRSEDRLGMAQNWNRACWLSQGAFVKLLMQDDELLPGALRFQVGLLERYPTAGYAFGPRVLSGDNTKESYEWIAKYSAPHERFAELASGEQLLSGPAVVRDITRGRLRANAIGEPSVVLMRRSTLNQVGPFNIHLRQLTDLDLWLRMARIADVAFDSRPVARFRVHRSSATMRNKRNGDAWLDRLWIVDSLAKDRGAAGRIGFRHYATAIAAGGRELAMALIKRRRSLATTGREIQTFLRTRRSNPVGDL